MDTHLRIEQIIAEIRNAAALPMARDCCIALEPKKLLALCDHIEDLHTKDSVRTREHNILTEENRKQAKEIAELKDNSSPLCDRLFAERDRLKAEVEEADRRAGEAERRLASEIDSSIRRDSWLRKAKEQWGVNDNTSFDVIWNECLTLRAEVARLQKERDADARAFAKELRSNADQIAQLTRERDDALRSLDIALTKADAVLRERDADKTITDEVRATLHELKAARGHLETACIASGNNYELMELIMAARYKLIDAIATARREESPAANDQAEAPRS